MELWYKICHILPTEMLQWDFMRNALLAILLMAPLFGLTSTMIVTGRMSFFSDALGHSAFTGIAIGCICGVAGPTWVAVIFAVGLCTQSKPPDRRYIDWCIFQHGSGLGYFYSNLGRR